MREHTPGPWVNGNTSDSIIAPGASYSPDADNDYYGGYVIAESVAPQNKPLIKAAPDLLAACEALLKFNEELCEDVGVSKYYPSAEKARVAIKKARGQNG